MPYKIGAQLSLSLLREGDHGSGGRVVLSLSFRKRKQLPRQREPCCVLARVPRQREPISLSVLRSAVRVISPIMTQEKSTDASDDKMLSINSDNGIVFDE